MSNLSAQVPEDFVRQIDALARRLDRSRAWVIKDALRQYLEGRALEEKRWQETVEAIEAAERGETVAADEIFAWLDTWGKPGERLEDAD